MFQYLEKFDLAPIFTIEEFQHWFLPQNGMINTFVVENDGKITDMVSYYTLPSSIMHHQAHKTLKAAYSFYNVSTVTPWLELMTDALISARNVSPNISLRILSFHILLSSKSYTRKILYHSWVSTYLMLWT